MAERNSRDAGSWRRRLPHPRPMIAAPFVRTAHAAGKLSIGFWDHWVPGANKASEALVEEWAAKEKVEVQIDYITSQGYKNLLTIAAESQAKSGHDILAMPTWWPQDQANDLEPVDDIMARLIKQNGAVNGTVEYLGKAKGNWLAVPADDRQPDQGALLAHRPHEAARRHRRAGDVSRGCGAQGRQLDPRHLSEGGRGLPQGRLPVRHRPRADLGLGRHRRRVLPVLRRRARQRQGRPHGQTDAGGRRSTTASAWPPSIRRTRRPGTTPPTTSGWSRARAR